MDSQPKIIKFSVLVNVVLAMINGYFIYTHLNSPINTTEVIEKTLPLKEEITARDISSAVNQYRYSMGLSPLLTTDTLCTIAELRVGEIQTDWSHDIFIEKSKDKNSTFFNLCNQDGICQELGENLGRNIDNKNELLLGWIFSPEHNKNLLGNYTHTCVAVDNNHYVQIFANIKN